ncbi:uncharacterized protein LOC119737190 isoform X1 [Patiria miniata]|uniref:MD-2-related lipid-recognition domain-containing protein n=1 Tax=Patiria miniata TaxID=46514 RepID=A0A914AUY4_PATMI|nr:uncharacterized protein LOC119737190 isoform X1 [Patiria miniata]
MAFVLTRLLILVAFVVISHEEFVKLGPGIEYENCGPPFMVTLSPNPPKLRKALYITVEIVAAYDLIAGVFEAYYNVWPYYYKDDYCADAKTMDPKGCYISKGETRVITKTIWVDDNFKETYYVANVTLRNEDRELLFCTRVRAKL